MILQMKNASFSYGRRMILRNVSGQLQTGKVIFLLGENASGKTTMLKLFARLLAPQRGEITLGGKDVSTFSRRDYAQKIGVASQLPRPALDLTAEEFCLIGRNAKLPRFSGATRADFAAVERALELVDLSGKAKSLARTLSGGEFQRLALAAALALGSDFLLLDEVVSAQDPPRAWKLLQVVKDQAAHCGILVIAHDLDLAAEFADEVWLLADGEIFAGGAPEIVLTPENLGRLYHCRVANDFSHPAYRFD